MLPPYDVNRAPSRKMAGDVTQQCTFDFYNGYSRSNSTPAPIQFSTIVNFTDAAIIGAYSLTNPKTQGQNQCHDV